MVGSEGTLGIITEVGLKLYSFPESISSAVCEFKELKVSGLQEQAHPKYSIIN